jgi:hypothetical protein
VTLARLAPDQQRNVLALAISKLKLRSAQAARPIGDPVAWVAERLGEHLWTKQAEIARSVAAHRRTAVQSCHGAGKSYTAARIAAWWLDTHAPGDAFVVSTAPTCSQVRAILWREIHRAHVKGHLPGHVNQSEWWIGGEIVGFGRKPSDYDPDAFQGIHARAVLVLIDEACGVPKSLWDAASTLVTNEDSRILAIGNPDDPSSFFAQVCRVDSGWSVLKIAASDTPNFSGEDVPPEIKPLLISPLWVEERRIEWGADSPLYVAKVTGEFPAFASDAVVPYSWAKQCQRLDAPLPDDGSVALGIDVGAGGDQSVIRERRGNTAGRQWSDHSADPEILVNLAMLALRETGASSINIDTIGVGYGVAGHLRDQCREAGLEVDVVSINVAERAQDPTRFINLRAELWWEVGRDLSKDMAWDLAAVDDGVISQLVAPKYSVARGGRIQVEAKDDVRRRIGRSPDDADALLLAFYRPPREVWSAV